MKGLPIVLKGNVVKGKGLGRTVGMPTANLNIYEGTLPETGVYITRIEVEGKVYNSLTNIGKSPSVDGGSDASVETLILDFNRDIYGKDVVLEILEFLRPVLKFASLLEVREQVEEDILEAKKILLDRGLTL